MRIILAIVTLPIFLILVVISPLCSSVAFASFVKVVGSVCGIFTLAGWLLGKAR